MTSTDLVPSVSIENLLGQRDAIVERIHAIRRTLNEAQALAAVALGGEGAVPYHLNLTIYGERDQIDDDRGVERMVKIVDTSFWAFLLDKSGLQTFLDTEAREQWRKAIDQHTVPELTFDNIHATFSRLYDARGAMFERGVVEIFRQLSWDYKTNCPRMFGKRIILTYAVETWRGVDKETHGPSQSGANKLDDLVRVFSVLLGQPEPDHRQGMYYTLNGLRWMRGGGPNEADLPFFALKGFKNGNAHLTFKRSDLVEKLNQILAKHHPNALPPETT